MRVATGALKHESNTFSDHVTDAASFQTVRGTAVHESEWASGTPIAGIHETLTKRGIEVVPTQYGHAIPGGVVDRRSYETLREDLLDRLRAAAPVDGVCLDLHGSMIAEGELDPEGAIVRSVRAVVGDVPVVTTLDMHATVTERFVDAVDGVAAYRTAPHTDQHETGVRGGRLLRRLLDGHHTTVRRIRIPMLLQGERSETAHDPMATLVDRLETLDARPSVDESTLLLGFPWADTPHAGCFAVVTGDATRANAVEEATRELADAVWSRRETFSFSTDAHPPGAALDVAQGSDRTPVVVSDTGDNPTAGASQDRTGLAALCRDRGLEDVLVTAVADEETCRACTAAGEGATVDIELGRSDPTEDVEPLSFTGAKVRSVFRSDGGETEGDVDAAMVVANDLHIVVTADRTPAYDPALVRRLGVDPAVFDVVIVKVGYLPAGYRTLAAERVFALTPGDTNQRLEDLEYDAVPRPIHPLEEFEWEPSDG
jgi:microcystin degradation protein MlrC